MKAYRILVHDDQYAAPVELAVEMAHDSRVAEFCRERMQKSAHVSMSFRRFSNRSPLR